ncbi:hypothetical protein Van01_12070 [Micromonospora andamanensis]|uniref:Uncharacterized protein n=1 Tax=Micromonospora andamanensis TaxID=1287068 RepID=A0ABQ4HQT8_9ACTN|nr:hypothetical protein Van01_12070 [Micromonospora andamanensis]
MTVTVNAIASHRWICRIQLFHLIETSQPSSGTGRAVARPGVTSLVKLVTAVGWCFSIPDRSAATARHHPAPDGPNDR